jgi:hypothetical protein
VLAQVTRSRLPRLVQTLGLAFNLALIGPMPIGLTLIGLTLIGPPAAAKTSKLSPAKVKQIKKTNKSFNNCRKDALASLKSGNVSKKKFEVMLTTCQESFPGASLYVACKKEAVRAAAANKIEPDAAAAQCQRYLLAASFDPTLAFPFFAEKGQLYFAGIGLNKDVPVKSLRPPNFDCEALGDAAADPQNAQYFLFGNHPNAFAALAKLGGKDLAKLTGVEKAKKAGVDIAGFGRIFGTPANDKAVVYFPSASCDFDGELGELFSGLSAYYLLDVSSGVATPYFGIAYYRDTQKSVTVAELVQQTVKGLGGNFRVYSKNKNKRVSFVASGSIAETDEEQDPKNLCKAPRDHRFIAVVQAERGKSGRPEYLLVANVKNLCDFGDKLARRLIE